MSQPVVSNPIFARFEIFKIFNPHGVGRECFAPDARAKSCFEQFVAVVGWWLLLFVFWCWLLLVGGCYCYWLVVVVVCYWLLLVGVCYGGSEVII